MFSQFTCHFLIESCAWKQQDNSISSGIFQTVSVHSTASTFALKLLTSQDHCSTIIQFLFFVLLGAADHECKFVTVNIGAYGRQSEGGVFRNSDLAKCLDINAFDIPASQQLPGSEDKTPLSLLGMKLTHYYHF
jgi:hypothetical protein